MKFKVNVNEEIKEVDSFMSYLDDDGNPLDQENQDKM